MAAARAPVPVLLPPLLLVSSVVAAAGPVVPPSLLVFYCASKQDNAVVATAAGIASLDASYAFIHASAPLPSNASVGPAGTVALNLYSNAVTRHHFSAASARGGAWALANGYELVGVQGWVYLEGDASFTALEQYSSVARGDHFLVGDAESRADAVSAGYSFEYIDSYVPAPWVVWPHEPHPNPPFARSTYLLDIELEWGRNAVPPNIGADTWYPSWAADGRLYSSFTDGTVAGVNSHSYSGPTATTGFATFDVHSDSRGRPDPFNMTMSNVGTFPESADPYDSRYPSLNFVRDGVWYYGTYALNNYVPGVSPPPDCGNWCVQSPFDGIRYSRDMSKTWTAPRQNMASFTDNLFGETSVNNTKVKFGAPHAVDFGQENQYAPEGRLYIVGHGAETPESHQSWMQGDSVYMARTTTVPDPLTINDAASWEFFAGGSPATWSGNLSAAQPLFVWPSNTGVVTLSWHPTLSRYIMVVSTPSISPSCVGNFDTYLLESSALTGPWALITYMASFGPEAYFVHIPGKFMDLASYPATAVNGARAAAVTGPATAERLVPLTDTVSIAAYYSFFLSYSADFASGVPNPPGSGYHWSLQQCRFALSSALAASLRAEPLAVAPL